MAIAEQDVTSALTSRNPASGEVVGTYPVATPAEVAAAVARARAAAAWWADLGFSGRRERLLSFKAQLARRSEELCDLIHRENGKPLADGFIEVLLTVDHLHWAARNAERVLGARRVSSGSTLVNQRASLEYQPLGVVAVIGPWNYPLFTPIGSIAYALAAGNAVVFKPSEYTPAVAVWLADVFATVVPEQPVLQVVTGDGATGRALCGAGVDKVAFTGSAATGRRVMAQCAETLTPVLLELGGKDALIVDDDADLDAAATAAVWGGLQNAGQACISIERVYVVDAVYDAFVDKVAALAADVRVGGEPDADIGPITMPGQLDVIRAHLEDAFARGARAVVGGEDAVHPPFVDPVVLVDVPHDALVIREETFGPVLPILRVRDADEAVEQANATRYGLAAAVFGEKRAAAIARRLRAGMTSINAVQTFAAVPALPFGGVGDSGFGRVHGEDGLKEFARAKAITAERFSLPLQMQSFRRHERLIPAIARLMKLRHGRG